MRLDTTRSITILTLVPMAAIQSTTKQANSSGRRLIDCATDIFSYLEAAKLGLEAPADAVDR